MSRPLSAVLGELVEHVQAIERIVPRINHVLDRLHGRPCPECGREQETADLDHHAPDCRLGDALAVLIAAMPEDA